MRSTRHPEPRRRRRISKSILQRISRSFAPLRMTSALLILLAAACVHHRDLTPREVNAYLSGGGSRMNFHGHSQFRSVHFEVAGQSAAARKWLRTPEAGASIAYSDVHQARSWFGYRYGDP